MSELLSKFDSAELIGLVALGGCLFLGLMGILLGFYSQWLEHRKAEMTVALKQDMLSRGMCADEIRIVLEAGKKVSRKDDASQQALASESLSG
jgi:hypothetical protein